MYTTKFNSCRWPSVVFQKTLVCVSVICKVCSKWSINPFTNPEPTYSHTPKLWQYYSYMKVLIFKTSYSTQPMLSPTSWETMAYRMCTDAPNSQTENFKSVFVSQNVQVTEQFSHFHIIIYSCVSSYDDVTCIPLRSQRKQQNYINWTLGLWYIIFIFKIWKKENFAKLLLKKLFRTLKETTPKIPKFAFVKCISLKLNKRFFGPSKVSCNTQLIKAANIYYIRDKQTY
jgi:hypothetical protein